MVILVAGGVGAFSLLIFRQSPPGLFRIIEVIICVIGFQVAYRAITPLVRSLKEDSQLRGAWGANEHQAFARKTIPQQVFALLIAVAEADGRSSTEERAMVRHILLQRFADPVSAEELGSWEAERVATDDIAALAHRVARGMSSSESATLFTWACLVAFVDDNFAPSEHLALQQVARGLGIAPEIAHMLFAFTRAQHLRQRGNAQEPRPRPRAQSQSDQQQQQRQQPATPTDREHALTTLGLPLTASKQDIRRRHRELVRRFHPDAQTSLGPIAQQEATERFRAIQRAYEMLAP
ncbi:hypothetical protein LBMAG49_06270 [Planctomycetota bacterium]|nr:hypothetical protein LBMAG49_06270 [Planctomycetota bacterium]